MFWTFVLGGPAFFSLICVIWQWLAATRFPLHQRVTPPSFTPPVAILKPLKGADQHTAACLRSWLEQDYPAEIQFMFGVASKTDAAWPVVEALIRDHPNLDIQLIECREDLGANAKVSKLIQLERQARHENVVVSDADVRVPPDFLANVVAPLSAAEVGLVTCFYRLANPVNLVMRWEAVGTNADFWSQVLQGRTLSSLDYALGAVMAMRRTVLRAAGGFEVLADYLADDFQLGRRVARSGRRIELCPLVAECWDPPMGWRSAWSHQIRWQRTIRVCKPVPYAFSLFANPLLWPLLLATVNPSTLSLVFLMATSILRMLTAADLLRRMNPGSREWSWGWLAPAKDALSIVLWLLAFGGNRIRWRGVIYRLHSDGRVVEIASENQQTSR